MIMAIYGIDVSKWQGNIDWAKVRQSGVEFVMIRVGVGASKGGFTKDSSFVGNLTGAFSAGIKCGVYLYSYAKSVAAAQIEADCVIKTLLPYRDRIVYPVAFDIEEADTARLGKAVCTDIANAFMDRIEQAGFIPMLYTNLNWIRTYLNMNAITRDIWLAQWGENLSYTKNVTMWQYSDKGTNRGINGHVDQDCAYKDYAAVPKREEAVVTDTVDDPVSAALAAVDALSENGVINTPDLWRDAVRGLRVPTPIQIAYMLIKWGKKL